MLNKIIALTAGLALSFAFTVSAANAEQSAQASATVVIYRAGEKPATSRLDLTIHSDQGSLGRLNAQDVIVVEAAAGEVTLGANISETQPVVLDLKPGQTRYVLTEMKMRGNRVEVTMVEVEERTARLQQPSLEELI